MFGISKDNKKEENYTKVQPSNAKGYHCISCKNCVESGNGNFMCQFGKPVLVVKNAVATNDYFWCNGKGYKIK